MFLHAVVDRGDPKELAGSSRRIFGRRRRRDREGQVASDHRRRLAHARQELGVVDLGRDARPHRAFRTDAPYERARVEAVQPDHPFAIEVSGEALFASRAAPALRKVPRDETGDVNAVRLRL